MTPLSFIEELEILKLSDTSKTFGVDRENKQNPYVGLLENKTLFLLLSKGLGAYEPGEANEHMNFQSSYLKLFLI